MQFKNYHEHHTSNTNTLDKVFENLQLPVNSFIHKGRCGIGGTFLALTYAGHTIITVPNRSIISSKQNEIYKYPYGFFPVQGGITVEDVKGHLIKTLKTPGAYIKLLVIPDSFDKVVEAANQVSKDIKSFKLQRDCFLLLDECHTFITEAFRGNILKPFKHFWDFTNKSVISATPYEFSDPRFAEMDYHNVTFHEDYLGKVDIVNCTSVGATLLQILNTPQYFPGKVFIFLNSVTDSIDLIKRSGTTDVAMFYADDEKNHEKLLGVEHYYEADTAPENYKKFNFFTCKYFEGWDLNEQDATMIFVTNVHSPHTKCSISIKGIQAVGRLRIDPKVNSTKPYKIYHLTNIRPITKMKTQTQYEQSYHPQAIMLIDNYNQCIKNELPVLPEIELSVKRYADIDPLTKIATINTVSFDQKVCESLTSEEYTSIEHIAEIWKKAGYEPSLYTHQERLQPTERKENRISQADKLKTLVAEFVRLEAEKESMPFNLGQDELNRLTTANPEAYKQFKALGTDGLTKLNYNARAIKSAMIERSNYSAEMKVKQLLPLHFQVGKRYTKDYIKTELQRLYNKVGLLSKQGSLKVATAEQLGDDGRYELHPCKISRDGSLVHGFEILRAQFELKVAA